MAELDLNEFPDDFDDCDGGPLYCTQVPDGKMPISIEGVGESPDLRSAPVQDVLSVEFRVAAAAAISASDATATETVAPAPAVFSRALTLPSHGGQVHTGGAGLFGFVVNEVRSSPQEPYVGMEFDTLAGAKTRYNAYALKIGFSMKASTSRRSACTNVLEKQTFCCNKSGKPKIKMMMSTPLCLKN